jgi:hypothetical protein
MGSSEEDLCLRSLGVQLLESIFRSQELKEAVFFQWVAATPCRNVWVAILRIWILQRCGRARVHTMGGEEGGV